MKTLLIALLFFNGLVAVSAQPTIQWQRSLGGTLSETAASIQQTNDDGYIVAGFTLSNNGDVSGYHGGGDWWVTKLDPLGGIQWQCALGGTSTESAFSVQQTKEGGYILAGRTYSNDGNVSDNHGEWDCWVVKLNSTGSIEWQKTLGGSSNDEAYSIQQTFDGGYIVAGKSESTDGDVSENHGYTDFWIVKLNFEGSVEWEKSLGGATGGESAYCVRQTHDGGYILAGETQSTDGDVTGQHGNDDCWIVKLDSAGVIKWQRALGGIASDRGWGIQQPTGGGYIMNGYAGSPDGDVTGWHGLNDYWVVKLSEEGDIQWQKTFGGSEDDWGRAIHQTFDGGFVVAGTTRSTDGDVLGNDGYQDIWVVKMDSNGEILWQKTLGGTSAEVANSILQTRDGGYIIAGESYSNDGDVSGNHGGKDFWIVKFSPESSPTTTAESSSLEIYPNPATHSISLQLHHDLSTGTGETLSICITNLLGQELRRQRLSTGEALNIATLPNGLYHLTATTSSGKLFSGRFTKLE